MNALNMDMPSAAPARPCLVSSYPSMATMTEADSPGTRSRMDVIDPPYIEPYQMPGARSWRPSRGRAGCRSPRRAQPPQSTAPDSSAATIPKNPTRDLPAAPWSEGQGSRRKRHAKPNECEIAEQHHGDGDQDRSRPAHAPKSAHQ